MPKRKDKGREGKDKGHDGKEETKKSPPPATSPAGEGGFQPLTSLNVPDPTIQDDPESSLRSQRSVSDASALTRESGRPSISRSEHEMELVEVTDGATGGASGGKEKKKWVSKMHRPPGTKNFFRREKDKKRPSSTFSGGDAQHVSEDASWVERASDWPSETLLKERQAEIEPLQAELRRVVKEKQTLEVDVKEREGQQAEIERLQADLQTLANEKERLERKKSYEIKEVEGRCKALINGKAGEFRRKDDEIKRQDDEIKRLQRELENLNSIKQSDVKEREGQQAEIERLQADLQTLANEKERLERKKSYEIKEVEGRCKALINGKAGEFRRKDDEIKRQDDEIKRLQRELENLNSIKQSDEATRRKLRDMMRKEKTTQHELARVTEDLQAASQREQGLQHDLSYLQGLHQEAIEGLNRDHQTQLQQLEEQLTQQIAEKLTADSEGKTQLAPPLADQSAGDALKKLETKCCLLESENQKLQAQMVSVYYTWFPF